MAGMARRKQPPLSDTPSNPPIRIALFIILTLIAIGNGIRTLLRFVFTLPLELYHGSARLISEVGNAAHSWFSEKKSTLANRATRKKSEHLIQQPFWNVDTTWIERFRTFMQRIRLPKIPKISLPNLKLFTVPIPKFHIRIYSFRTPTLHLPPRPKTEPRQSPGSLYQIKPFIIGVVLTIVCIFIPYNTLLFLKSLPNPRLLSERDVEVSTKILDRNGQLLYEIYFDQNRTPVKLESIPTVVKQATIAIEDGEFYYHPGFSIKGILRALSEIIVHKKIQGGSTITQQLIKSALLTPEVTLVRKTKEIILAFWAERLYTKDQILEMYLNQVPYGGTSWGIEAAAQTYFHKTVGQLSLAEAALLAGLPQAPSEYSPFGSHPEQAIQRQHEVLRSMLEDGYITEQQLDKAMKTKISFATPRVGIRAPHFVMYVKDLLDKTYGPRLVERGGLRVVTSIDLKLQEKVEYIVKTHIDNLERLSVGNGAALVTDPRSGDILAMVGSRDYFDTTHDGNVNVTTAERQPGSSIKVVTYAAALENGLTAATLINDAPITYQQAGSETYAPVNYDGKFHGPTPLRFALANSYNIPAVKVLAQIGIPVMLDKAKLMGINSWNDPSRFGLSLTLGGGDVMMTEMAKVYGTLANLGKRQDLRPILQVTDYTGKVLQDFVPSKTTDALKPEVAWIISDILADNVARTSAFGPNSSLVIPGKTVSVKTGTTNDKRDNWTIGYTPSFVTTVWVGNNDNSPMNPTLTSGITGAAPIWHDIMVELLKDRPDESHPKPSTIVSIPCYFNKVEYFISGTQPASGRCAAIPTITPTPNP